jgi:arsenic resistance protein ArsH
LGLSQRFVHAPRFLILYGSLRERSFSRFLAYEAARLLEAVGGEVRIYDAHGLPLPDDTTADHPKVQELRALSIWSEGQVRVSPDRHGNLTGVMKSQIDWLPLSEGSVRPTQGRTLAVMRVSGGSQSFNAVNSLRVLGRWMRMIATPNQSSVTMAYKEFDEAGRKRPRPLYDRVVDVCEALIKFTLLTRERTDLPSGSLQRVERAGAGEPEGGGGRPRFCEAVGKRLTFPLWEGSQSGRILRRTPSHEEPDCERDSLATAERCPCSRHELLRWQQGQGRDDVRERQHGDEPRPEGQEGWLLLRGYERRQHEQAYLSCATSCPNQAGPTARPFLRVPLVKTRPNAHAALTPDRQS